MLMLAGPTPDAADVIVSHGAFETALHPQPLVVVTDANKVAPAAGAGLDGPVTPNEHPGDAPHSAYGVLAPAALTTNVVAAGN